MWDALTTISEREHRSVNDLVTAINDRRGETAMTSAVRVFVLAYYQRLAKEMEHILTNGRNAPRPINLAASRPDANALLDDIFG